MTGRIHDAVWQYIEAVPTGPTTKLMLVAIAVFPNSTARQLATITHTSEVQTERILLNIRREALVIQTTAQVDGKWRGVHRLDVETIERCTRIAAFAAE